MDIEIENAIATDISISGITLSVEKIVGSFIFNFENSTKVIDLGRNEIYFAGLLIGQYEAYIVQNKINEIGRYMNNKTYENIVTISNNNLLFFESIKEFNQKTLKIKNTYIKQPD